MDPHQAPFQAPPPATATDESGFQYYGNPPANPSSTTPDSRFFPSGPDTTSTVASAPPPTAPPALSAPAETSNIEHILRDLLKNHFELVMSSLSDIRDRISSLESKVDQIQKRQLDATAHKTEPSHQQPPVHSYDTSSQNIHDLKEPPPSSSLPSSQPGYAPQGGYGAPYPQGTAGNPPMGGAPSGGQPYPQPGAASYGQPGQQPYQQYPAPGGYSGGAYPPPQQGGYPGQPYPSGAYPGGPSRGAPPAQPYPQSGYPGAPYGQPYPGGYGKR